MEIRGKRKWISLTLLSLVVPMGLLATFRLTGILQEPLTISETKRLEAVKWELERPHYAIDIKDTVKSFYNDESISINYSTFVGQYVGESQDYGGSDFINMIVNVTVTADQGFISSINITFWEDYKNSEVRFVEVQAWPKFYSHAENLSIINYAHHVWGKGLKAFMELASVNHPKNVHFDGIVHWILRSPQNKTHLMEVAIELIYFNGTAYKKIVQPLQLKIGPDDNNSFEAADAIEQGVNSWLHLGGYDVEDYYKIRVDHGYTISINASGTSIPKPAFYLDLYNPKGEWKNGSSKWNYSHTITYIADSAGDWFIRTRIYANFGFYSLTVNIYPPEGD